MAVTWLRPQTNPAKAIRAIGPGWIRTDPNNELITGSANGGSVGYARMASDNGNYRAVMSEASMHPPTRTTAGCSAGSLGSRCRN